MRFSFTLRSLFAAGTTLALALGFGGYAFATTANGTLSVSATITTTCTISSPTLAFGSISDLTQETDAQASVTVNCSNGGHSTNVSFDNGTYGEGTSAATNCDTSSGGANANNRCMSDGTHTLAYNIYTNTQRTTLFGLTGTNNTSETTSFTVYGKIPANQSATNSPAGSYSDSVTETLNY